MLPLSKHFHHPYRSYLTCKLILTLNELKYFKSHFHIHLSLKYIYSHVCGHIYKLNDYVFACNLSLNEIDNFQNIFISPITNWHQILIYLKATCTNWRSLQRYTRCSLNKVMGQTKIWYFLPNYHFLSILHSITLVSSMYKYTTWTRKQFVTSELIHVYSEKSLFMKPCVNYHTPL
jgi:hypothetical protein